MSPAHSRASARLCPLWTFTITTSWSFQVLSSTQEKELLISNISKDLSEPVWRTRGHLGSQTHSKNNKCSFRVSIWRQSRAVITGMGRDRMSLAKTTGKRSVSWNLVCLHYLCKANMSSSNWANSPDLWEQLIIKHAQQPKFQQHPRAALSSSAWLWTDRWPRKFMSVCKILCGQSSDRGNKTIFRLSPPTPWRWMGSDPPHAHFQTSVRADYCNCA